MAVQIDGPWNPDLRVTLPLLTERPGGSYVSVALDKQPGRGLDHRHWTVMPDEDRRPAFIPASMGAAVEWRHRPQNYSLTPDTHGVGYTSRCVDRPVHVRGASPQHKGGGYLMQVPDLRGLNGVTAISSNWGLTTPGSSGHSCNRSRKRSSTQDQAQTGTFPQSFPRRSQRCLSETSISVV
jgi:hypothetical protein